MSYGFGYGYQFGKSGSGVVYDPDALVYFNAFGDLPTNYKEAVNTYFYLAIKNANLWDKFKFGILPAVTLDDTKTVTDLKTGTILTGAALKGNVETGFRSQMTTPLPIGFVTEVTGDYIKSGAVMSALHTVNDLAFGHGILEDFTGATARAYGAQNSASQNAVFVPKTASNTCISDLHTSTANAGRNTFSGVTDGSGRWIQNRRSATDFEVYKSGSSVGTAANGGGSLPSIEVYVGCFNSSGTPTSFLAHTCTYHLEFSGLTAAERNSLETIMAAFETNLGSLRTLTRNLIWDGNSLALYDNWGSLRAASYYAYSTDKKLYRTRNFAEAGKTTAEMLSEYAAAIAPQYNAAYAVNVYSIDELRNSVAASTPLADIKTELTDLVAAAKATGYEEVQVFNVRFTDKGGYAGTETAYNLAMDEISTFVSGNSFGADKIIEVNNPNMWRSRSEFSSDAEYNTYVAGCVANPIYYNPADKIHGTAEYNRIMGYNAATQALDIIG